MIPKLMKQFRVPWSLVVALFVLSLAGLDFVTLGSTYPLPPAVSLESITAQELRKHVEFLASDELGGRHTLSPSNAIVARYLASRLRSFGFRGGAKDGSFFQKFDLVTQQFNPDESFLEVIQKEGPVRFHIGKDVSLTGTLGEADVRGEMVLLPLDLATSKTSHELNLSGKIALVPVGGLLSEGGRNPRRAGQGQRQMIREVIRTSQQLGAAAVILLLRANADSPRASSNAARPPSGGRLVLPEEVRAPSALPIVQVSDPRVMESLLRGTRFTPQEVFSPSLAAGLRPLQKQARVKTSMQGPKVTTQNVIGILEGGDPQLKQEYVLFAAHMDHLATVGTEVFNGADDDASGTAAVLEIAQAFALGPAPRRSILIIFHTGEEEGLLGSKYFVQHPVVPLESIVVVLNVDMIGRSRAPDDTHPANRELSDANTLYLIGSDKLSHQLHELSEQTNQDTVKMTLDYRYNHEEHPLRLYYRSDHWNYARLGIPVIFYFTGLHQDYHKPTDDVEKLDFEKMVRITRLIFATGWRVANLNQRLKLDAQSP